MRGMKPLEKLRTPLLDVHRALLEGERGDRAPADFLQALIKDPELEWIKPLTTLVASLDELLASEEFQSHYRDALQRDPKLAFAHGRLAVKVTA
jgi:hypothetical protein